MNIELLKKVVAMGFTAAFLALFLAGCETTKGFGEDVENAGDAIEDAAD